MIIHADSCVSLVQPRIIGVQRGQLGQSNGIALDLDKLLRDGVRRLLNGLDLLVEQVLALLDLLKVFNHDV